MGATLAAEARGESGPARRRKELFQISQRADYINNDLFEWVQFNRAIINTRDEPLADARKYRRLHLLHGDTNVLPTSLLLKVGTTSLALDLLEMNCLPKTPWPMPWPPSAISPTSPTARGWCRWPTAVARTR